MDDDELRTAIAAQVQRAMHFASKPGGAFDPGYWTHWRDETTDEIMRLVDLDREKTRAAVRAEPSRSDWGYDPDDAAAHWDQPPLR